MQRVSPYLSPPRRPPPDRRSADDEPDAGQRLQAIFAGGSCNRMRAMTLLTIGQKRMTSARVTIEPTSGLDQKMRTLPPDRSIDWRNEVSAMSPSTSASTSGASGNLSFLNT